MIYSITKWLLIVFTIISFPKLASSSSLSNEASNLCQDLDYIKEIRSLWRKRKPIYQQWISASDKTPYNLYNIQGETNNLLKYSDACNDQYILNELVSLFLKAIDTLDETSQYTFYYYPANKRRSIHSLDKKYKMWLDEKEPIGDETILVSAQFLALISETINIIARKSAQERSPRMSRFIREYFPVLKDHYVRWVLNEVGPFQVNGWGCKIGSKNIKTGMNHKEFIEKKNNRQLGDDDSPSYCNAVTDADLWIFSGISNMLAAEKKDPRLFSLKKKFVDSLSLHLEAGLELMSKRITETDLKDFEGRKTKGVIFDLGAWNDHPTYLYADIASKDIRGVKNIPGSVPEVNLGWDLSHARRFVHVFDSLYRNKLILKVTFPSELLMRKLSNQLLYGVFNKVFNKPLFANFMDGTNGWFRVGYSGRKGFGYAPWDMSSSVLTGGFGFWSVFNKDIEVLFGAMVNMLRSDDPKIRRHVEEYYEKNVWVNFERKKYSDFGDKNNTYTQSVLIQFIPSMCFHSVTPYQYYVGASNNKSDKVLAPTN